METIVKHLILLIVVLELGSINLMAQESTVENPSSVNIRKLPEYVVITSENTKTLGELNITINSEKSAYSNVLQDLETLLQDSRNLQISNHTDLLSIMAKMGFEYIDTYIGTARRIGSEEDEDQTFAANSNFRINMVFRKQLTLRG